MRSNTPARRWLSMAETAELFNVEVRTIRRWISDGRLTAYRVGPALVRLDADELDALARPIPAAGGAV